jgi:hypothetical protein
MRKKLDGMALPVGVASAGVVGVLWTLVAGTFWQWLPIAAGVVLALGAARAIQSGGAGPPDKVKGKKG